MNVYPAYTADENRTDALALRAYCNDGLETDVLPVVTATEFRSFVSAWQSNDPDGTWNTDGVTERSGELVYVDTEGNVDIWHADGHDESGAALYGITGWSWTL